MPLHYKRRKRWGKWNPLMANKFKLVFFGTVTIRKFEEYSYSRMGAAQEFINYNNANPAINFKGSRVIWCVVGCTQFVIIAKIWSLGNQILSNRWHELRAKRISCCRNVWKLRPLSESAIMVIKVKWFAVLILKCEVSLWTNKNWSAKSQRIRI